MADNIEERTEEAAVFLKKGNTARGESDYLLNSLTIPNTQLNQIVEDMVQELVRRLGYKPEEMMDYKLTLRLEASERQPA